jgi:hypothetical protein
MYTRKDLREVPAQSIADRSVRDLLVEAEKAGREGKTQYAYQLSVQATRVAPENIEAWSMRLALAPTFEERVACMNRLNELSPEYRDRYNLAFFTQKELVDRDPFLAYKQETDEIYRVINGDHLPVSIRKKRASANPFLYEPSSRLRSAYGWLTAAIAGLLLAGIGTIIFAPLAALAAVQAGQHPRSRAEWGNSMIVLLFAILLFLVGAGLLFLFVLHWLG